VYEASMRSYLSGRVDSIVNFQNKGIDKIVNSFKVAFFGDGVVVGSFWKFFPNLRLRYAQFPQLLHM